MNKTLTKSFSTMNSNLSDGPETHLLEIRAFFKSLDFIDKFKVKVWSSPHAVLLYIQAKSQIQWVLLTTYSIKTTTGNQMIPLMTTLYKLIHWNI
jgi:hypothetical protein